MANVKKKFTVYGNCQAEAWAKVLTSFKSFSDKYIYEYLKPCFSISNIELQEWIANHKASLNVLISHNLRVGWQNDPVYDISSVSRALRHKGKLILYTDFYYRGCTPSLVYPKFFQRAPFCDYLDLLILTLFIKNAPPRLYQDMVYDENLLTEQEIEDIRRLSINALIQRESTVDIKISEYIAANPNIKTFFTFNHPRIDVLREASIQVLNRMGVPVQIECEDKLEEVLDKVKFPDLKCLKYASPESNHLVLVEGNSYLMVDFSEQYSTYLEAQSEDVVLDEYNFHLSNDISRIVLEAADRWITKWKNNQNILNSIEERLPMSKIGKYIETTYNNIEGWCPTNALLIAESLNAFMAAQGINGDVAEIGVHHGKFILGLATLLDENGTAYAIDVFENQVANIDKSGSGSRDFLIRNAEKVMADVRVKFDLKVIQEDSTDLNSIRADAIQITPIKFFSVDGGHTLTHAMNDLLVAEKYVCKGGVVIVDDIFNWMWPGVLQGVIRYLSTSSCVLQPFLLTQSKLYLTTATFHERYLNYVLQSSKDLPLHRYSDLTWERDFIGFKVAAVHCS